MIDFALVNFGTRKLADPLEWELNVSVVKLLCSLADEVVWYTQWGCNIPETFTIDGVAVRFLPHWGFYKVGGHDLNRPDSAQDVVDAVAAVKVLSKFALKPAKN